MEDKIIYESIKYKNLDDVEVAKLVEAAPAAEQDAINAGIESAKAGSAQKALGNMAIFPVIMLVAYILLFLYFKSKGGYKARRSPTRRRLENFRLTRIQSKPLLTAPGFPGAASLFVQMALQSPA